MINRWTGSPEPNCWLRKQFSAIKYCKVWPLSVAESPPGHVCFSASAIASPTIFSSQGLLHSLLSSACSFTHSYWFFIDLRCPPVPPLVLHPPLPPSHPSFPSPSARWKGSPSLTLISSPSLDFCSGSLSRSHTANLGEKAAARQTPRCGEERCVWITPPIYCMK